MKWLLALILTFSLQNTFANEFEQYLNNRLFNYASSFENMWNESMGENPSSKKYEIFGLLIFSPEGEYKVRNYTQGSSTSSVSTDYTHTRDEMLVGQVHTHPQVYVTHASQFDSQTPPSSTDIVSLYERKGAGSLKIGFISFVLSAKKIYALIIEDEAKALAHFEKMKADGLVLNKSLKDYSYDIYTRSNVGKDIFEMQLNAAKRITGNAEDSGIGFYQTEGTEKLFFERIN